MKKVFLVGYMGVGKTTWGKRLANALGVKFYDLDEEIVASESRSIQRIFEEDGESHFREAESALLNKYCHLEEDFVLSTGGGTVNSDENVSLMKRSGVVVWLDLPIGMIQSRLAKSKTRPLLNDKSPEERNAFIEAHFAERQAQYQKADIQFDMSRMNAERLAQLTELIQSR